MQADAPPLRVEESGHQLLLMRSSQTFGTRRERWSAYGRPLVGYCRQTDEPWQASANTEKLSAAIV